MPPVIYPIPILAKISGCSLWMWCWVCKLWISHLFSKYSNLCDYETSTSQQGWNCRGVGGSTPSSCLQTPIFEWKSALNFNPWAKVQTFRHDPQFFYADSNNASQTDRWTDGWTDGRFAVAISRSAYYRAVKLKVINKGCLIICHVNS